MMKFDVESRTLFPFNEMTSELKMIACGPQYIVGLVKIHKKETSALKQRRRSRRGLSTSIIKTARDPQINYSPKKE